MKKTLVILALMLCFASPAHAAIQQMRVLGIGVDHSSVAAEAAAVDYAKKRAVYLIARKLQVDNASAKIATLKPEEFNRLIRGATVMNLRREKEVTYADVNVSVVDTELRRVLGLPAVSSIVAENAVSARRSVLVLPVYRAADKTYLWEADNPMKESLRSEVLRQSQGAVLVPAGDFEDLRLIDGNNAGTVTGGELKPMFERYGAQEIIIVIVTLGAEQSAEPTHITLRRLTPDSSRVETMQLPAPDAKDTRDARIAVAANAIAHALTQIATATSPDEQQSMAKASRQSVQFVYANPRELGQMEQSVRHADGVILLETPNINLQNIRGTVYFTGDKDALKAALIKKGVLVNDKDGGWALSLR